MRYSCHDRVQGIPSSKRIEVSRHVKCLPNVDMTRTPRYIVAQIFGGYVACLLVYAQYKDLITVSIPK